MSVRRTVTRRGGLLLLMLYACNDANSGDRDVTAPDPMVPGPSAGGMSGAPGAGGSLVGGSGGTMSEEGGGGSIAGGGQGNAGAGGVEPTTPGQGGAGGADMSENEVPALTPRPISVTMQPGLFVFGAASSVLFETRAASRAIETSLEPLARVLAAELELLTGTLPAIAELPQGSMGQPGDVVLKFAPVEEPFALQEDLEDQAYELVVTDRVAVSSAYMKGVAYGTATLLQALGRTGEATTVPRMMISDAPRAAYRTIMIDVARQRHSLGVLRQVIRMARLYKVRYVHLHLTDNENFVFPFAPVTDNVANNYTFSREELSELVAYADARGVTLIPELDLPGHSTLLRASGYLGAAANDRDVADPANYAKIQAIIDDMLSVFHSSPYFHIGGDESSAGDRLEPFLAEMNQHLRGKPVAERRRMLVWEGFQGSPAELPATGEDRVLVLSWESSYNPPWNLLEAGYTLINASWKPLYVVGGGGARHPGASGRAWSPETIYSWDADTFMHWEPGRPVYEDQGPNDPEQDDGIWKASYIGKGAQILGGQMLYWEQHESVVIRGLESRVPAFAERLWNPQPDRDYQDFAAAQARVEQNVGAIVSPVHVGPETEDATSPTNVDYASYSGESVAVTLSNRTRLAGSIRYQLGTFSNQFGWILFDKIPAVTVESELYAQPFEKTGGFGVRAQLFRADGVPVAGSTWSAFNNWQQRVRVTEVDIGRETPAAVPDLTAAPPNKVLRTVMMPMIRGPYTHTRVLGQLQETVLTLAQAGSYEFSVKTQSGRATLYLDLNQDGEWSANEALIVDTPTSEVYQSATVELMPGKYNLRIDHAAGLPRPVLSVVMAGPGTDERADLTTYLSAPE